MINPSHANLPILSPLKQQKTNDFLVILGGLKWEYWPTMDLKEQAILQNSNKLNTTDNLLF